MWCWSRLLKIQRTDKVTYQEILKHINVEELLIATINQQKFTYFGHVMQITNRVEKSIMLGKTNGPRKRGRPRMRWIDSITNYTSQNLADMRSLTADRKK